MLLYRNRTQGEHSARRRRRANNPVGGGCQGDQGQVQGGVKVKNGLPFLKKQPILLHTVPKDINFLKKITP